MDMGYSKRASRAFADVCVEEKGDAAIGFRLSFLWGFSS